MKQVATEAELLALRETVAALQAQMAAEERTVAELQARAAIDTYSDSGLSVMGRKHEI